MGKIIGGLVAIIAVLAVVIAMQPSEMTVTREAKMSASPDIVFAQVNNLHAWETWSPWEKLDPAMEKTFSGAPEGKGATYAWTSKDKKIGTGSMTITNAKAPERIDIKLDFIEPFKATNDVTFTFAPEGDGTKVSWSMHAAKNFMMKAFGMVNDMDKMLGTDFERGLTALSALSEAKAKEAQAAAAAQAQAAQAAAEPTSAVAPAPAPQAPKKKHR